MWYVVYSSQIRVTLVGKEDRREAKCEQLGSVSQSSCYSSCSSRSGSKSLSMPGFSSPYTAQHEKGEYNVTATLAPSFIAGA